MDQSIDGGESRISPEIAERIKTEGCPDCGLKGGTHVPECYYFGAISPDMAAVKKPVVSETPEVGIAGTPAEKKEENQTTRTEEEKFRKELLERAKAHEEFVKTAEPVVGIVKPAEILAPGTPEKEGVFEELFIETKKTETPVVEKSVAEVSVELKKEVPEEKPKEIISPAVEIKPARSDLPEARRAVSEVKEAKKELKKEEVAANAVVAAVEMARDFILAGSTKITEEQAEKAAATALKDWERITTGMTAAERYEIFKAAERAVLEKIPEGKILEKIKGKIFVEVKEEK